MRKVITVLAVVAVLAIGLTAVAGIAAQEINKQDKQQALLSKVAEKLGVSEEQLTQALKDARFEMIDEAVAAGQLTEEQAAKLKERIEENGGAFFGPGPEPRGGDPWERPCQTARFVVRATAEVLDVEPQEVVDALESGQSLAEFAESQGMSAEDFEAALLEEVRIGLDKLVSDGKLTQERADAIYERFSNNVDRIINAHPDTNDMAPCHGRGHYRHGPGNGEGQGETPPNAKPSRNM